MGDLLNSLGPLLADQFTGENPVEALVREQKKKEEEEKRKQAEAAAQQAADQARQAQARQQMQAPQPTSGPSVAQTQQQLATQYANPDDLRMQKWREVMGMRQDQQKPTWGQKASVMLQEMVRSMAQGSKYKPLQDRISEESARDLELRNQRMQAITSMQRADDMAQRYSQLDNQFQAKLAQDKELAQQRMATTMAIKQAQVDMDSRKLDSKQRIEEAKLALSAQRIPQTPARIAALSLGIVDRFEKDPDTGDYKTVYAEVTPEKWEEYAKRIKEIRPSKEDDPAKVIVQNVVTKRWNPETRMMENVLTPSTKWIGTMRPDGTSNIPGFSRGEEAPASPEQPPRGGPQPSGLPTGINDPLQGKSTVIGNSMTSKEIGELNDTQKTQVQYSTGQRNSARLFREWVASGKNPNVGLGKYTEDDVAGVSTRGITQSETAWRLRKLFASGDDMAKQQAIREYEDLKSPMDQAEAAKMLEQGGRNLTEGEKKIIQRYWPKLTDGAISYQRNRTLLAGVNYLHQLRLARNINPSSEMDLSQDLRTYVNTLIDKTLKSPKAVKDEDFDPQVFIPRLLATQSARRKERPSTETFRPPVINNSRDVTRPNRRRVGGAIIER